MGLLIKKHTTANRGLWIKKHLNRGLIKKHTTANRGLLAYDSKSFDKKAYDSKSWTFDKKA